MIAIEIWRDHIKRRRKQIKEEIKTEIVEDIEWDEDPFWDEWDIDDE